MVPKHVNFHYRPTVGRVAQSVQRLATGWTVRGSNPGGGEIFLTCPDRPWGPPNLLYNGYWVFPGGKEQPGREADPSSPSSAVIKKEQSYTSTPPMGRAACTEHQCLYRGALYLSPFRPTTFCERISNTGFFIQELFYEIPGFPSKQLRTTNFCVITQRVVVSSYRRFGTTYWSHLQGQIWTRQVVQERQ